MKKKVNNLKLNFEYNEPQTKTITLENIDIEQQINDAKINWNTYLITINKKCHN